MDYMSYIRAIRSSDLTTAQKITAIMIASHYDFSKGDPAFPSNKLLAKETGLSVRSIVRAKKVLSERHYLMTQRQYNNANLSIPMDPMSQGYGHNGQLNTHINTQLNTKEIHKEIQSNSNEFDNVFENIDTGEIFNISSETIANPPVEFKANAAAAKIIEEDWLSW
jgi:hypothetical protein